MSKAGTLTGVPKKVSEVKRWLETHQPVSAALLASLARRPKQSASEKAAAVRALGLVATEAALEVLGSYRPEDQEGQMGDTFNDPVAKEIAAAWPRFDRRAFAQRVFGRLDRIFLSNAGPLPDLTGIDAAKQLEHVSLRIAPGCDVSPLASLPKIRYLQIEDVLDQRGIDVLATAKTLERLLLVVAPASDLSRLLELPALKRLKLLVQDGSGSATGEPAPETVRVIRALVERGVELMQYEGPWPLKLAEKLGDLVVVRSNGFIALTKDPARSEALREAQRMNSFPFYF